MGNQIYNPEELKLFKSYPGLWGAVTGTIYLANKETVARFGTFSGKNPRAYHTCLYACYIASKKGEAITRLYIRAHESSNSIDPTVRSSNLHNGEIGIQIAIQFSHIYYHSGSVNTKAPVTPSTSSSNVLAINNSGGADVEMAVGKGMFLADECYRAFKKGLLKTDGY